MSGWILFHRSEETTELLAKEPKAFVLLALIAQRARWKNAVIPDGLKKGEALIGKNDFEKAGLTEHDYRRAKEVLERAKLVSFRRAKGTAKPGTVATLLDARVFSLTKEDRNEANNEVTAKQQRSDHEATTKPQRQTKKGKNEQEGEEALQNEQNGGAMKPPSLEEALQLLGSESYPLEKEWVEKWHAGRESVGWVKRGAPIQNWRADLKTYALSWQNNLDERAPERKGKNENDAHSCI